MPLLSAAKIYLMGVHGQKWCDLIFFSSFSLKIFLLLFKNVEWHPSREKNDFAEI